MAYLHTSVHSSGLHREIIVVLQYSRFGVRFATFAAVEGIDFLRSTFVFEAERRFRASGALSVKKKLGRMWQGTAELLPATPVAQVLQATAVFKGSGDCSRCCFRFQSSGT